MRVFTKRTEFPTSGKVMSWNPMQKLNLFSSRCENVSNKILEEALQDPASKVQVMGRA